MTGVDYENITDSEEGTVVLLCCTAAAVPCEYIAYCTSCYNVPEIESTIYCYSYYWLLNNIICIC